MTRLVIYSRESHLEIDPDAVLAVGDKLDAVRGNGPHEGQRMGYAVVTGFNEDGQPDLDVEIGG